MTKIRYLKETGKGEENKETNEERNKEKKKGNVTTKWETEKGLTWLLAYLKIMTWCYNY